jgi:hypothetical protein
VRRMTFPVLQFLGISLAVMMAASALGIALTTSASMPAAVGKSAPGRAVVIGPHGLKPSHRVVVNSPRGRVRDVLANRTEKH